MIDFAVIVPTRDRRMFFDHCREQLDRQTLQPKARYYISYAPTSPEMDLVRRVKSGIELAQRDGIDLVFIVEDDDKYPDDYFQRFQPYLKDFEFFGDEFTTYYNLRNQTYRTWHHPNRASLFTTAFKISALNLFDWPADNEKFLDIKLWQYARRRKKKFVKTDAIGIKHNLGLVGGKGHIMRFNNVDTNLKFLREHTNGSFDFYQQIMKQL